MEYIVAHHDEGWLALDDQGLMDERTHLPYHLTQTPLPELIKTGAGSPDFNEAHHPYSGLISSMHTWGLYNGRYGLSDKLFIDSIAAQMRPEVVEGGRHDMTLTAIQVEFPGKRGDRPGIGHQERQGDDPRESGK